MAGTIKANAVQLGDSVTAANNFVLQTNTDGTAKLARGNLGETTQDILTVDAAGKVTLAQTPNTQLGVEQTWQEFSIPAQRAKSTTYTNSTSKPICISIRAGGTAAISDSSILVGAVKAANIYLGTAQNYSLTAIVPAGATYQVVIGGTHVLDSWVELR